MTEATRSRSGRAAWRFATLLIGAALAAWVAILAAESLALGETSLRVGQGPHQYVRGRNYPGSEPAPVPDRRDVRDAEAPQNEDVLSAPAVAAS